jgi:type I restriction enzyme, S subunit
MKIDTSAWDKVTLGDIAQSLTIATKDPLSEGLERYVGLEHIEPGNIHIKSWGDVADGTTFTRVFRKGQVLFGKRRAYQKKAAVAEFDGICSGDILVCEAIKDVVVPELLPFIVQSDRFFEHAIKTSAGSLSPRTKFKDLAKFTFKLPVNPADQKRIADLLWSIDRAIESYNSLLSSIDACKKSALIDIGNKQESLREIGEVVDILDNQRKPLNSEQRASMKGSIPYYGANGIVDTVNDCIFDEDLVLVAEDGGNFHDYLTKTIAYMISGKSWVNNHAHVLKAKKCLRIKWLFYCLVHKDITKYIVGTTRVKLNQGALSKIRIYVPDIPEQDRLIAQIDSIFEAEKNVRNQISVSEQIKKQIINQIFG